GSLGYLSAVTGRYNGQLEFFRRDPVAGSAGSDAQTTVEVAESKPVVSPVTFFGVAGTGARIAFILDASESMVSDENGGTFSYSFIKDQVLKGVEGLQSNVQFNVILHNGQQLALFQPQMVPAVPENIAALKVWLLPVDSDPLKPGFPENPANGFPVKDYGTIVGVDSSGWVRALQAAMEQKSDVVFMTGTGWGEQMVNREKGHKLLDFSVWDSWISGATIAGDDTQDVDEEGNVVDTSSAPTTTTSANGAAIGQISLKPDKKQRDALLKEALKAIEEENKLRKAQGLPQPFVRDVLSYLRYTPAQIRDHLNTVIQSEYAPGGVIKPVINFVCLVPAESGDGGIETDRNLRKLTGDYEGSLVVFHGADTKEKLRDLNRSLDSVDWQIPAELP
ncbi:MAG: hypothetical protein WC047_06510, partial [Kiritimatiellales bacterium]